jgi:hypothetical protein
MNCPACERELKQLAVGDVTVDVCEGGCGGIWFDPFELRNFDELHESAGEALLEIGRDPSVSVDHTRKKKCPRCLEFIMMQHFFGSKRDVEIDECPSCAGIWLDVGELGRIRSLYDTEEKRSKAANQCLEDVFGDKIAAMQAESAEKLARSRRIARMFRFICPSNYIPGKQEWGAF